MQIWFDNDAFIASRLIEEDTALQHVLEIGKASNLPEMGVSATQGKFLYLLALIKNAKRIPELGTFCGYSTIWLAKAVPDDGIVISLEYDETYFDIAQRNIDFAGLSSKVKLFDGDAADTLRQLIASNEEPFDMIFIDADKPGYPLYLELALQLSKSGTVIYADNVIRGGELCNADNSDPKVRGVRRYVENLKKLQSVESTALQTVGIKGYDGFALSVIK